MKRLTSFALAALALAAGCDANPPKPGAGGSAAPPAAAASSAADVPSIMIVPTPGRPATFSSADGAALSGELFVSPEPNAPALILVHRLNGDRAELEPLVRRLVVAPKRFTILSLDLRGHGASKAPPKAKAGDTQALARDVEAAVAHVIEATEPRAVVLVGTSVGAALSSQVAFGASKVTALALVSPGESIAGHPLYKPYSEVRNLPTFVAGAKDDTVSKAAVDALEKMAMKGTVKRYEGSRHSAQFLGEEHPELWGDLESWVLGVFSELPAERKSLYLAPGKEPKKPGAGPKKGGGPG
ncbi:MAG: alpha/beta fold hydrolase [Polyangiaceae bacterium]|nr:alpha/beta fold hydrolase [Polyangiaceae bacterium]